jgi:hypothetical protein
LALARITGVVGVGHNVIKFGVETLGSSVKDKIPAKRMVVSFSLDIFCLTCIQRLKCFFFHRFLKLMRDFADEDRVWDGFTWRGREDHGKIICDMFGSIDWE